MGKKEKELPPCIAIKDGKQCNNTAYHGITTDGVTRICYCDYHWLRLQENNSINLNLSKIKTIREKDKKNYKKIKEDLEAIKKVTGCNENELDTEKCAVKIKCPKGFDKCEDGYYIRPNSSPRTPAYVAPGSKTAYTPVGGGTPRSTVFVKVGPSPTTKGDPFAHLLPVGTPRSPVSSVKSKTSKKSKDESESESESESDANDSSTDSESGSDVSDSDSEAESSSNSEAEVKTKLRVPGYGGKNKKIINYKSIKKDKGVKPNARDIRGRYEVMRSDIAPHFKIRKEMVEVLKELDTTYDMDIALERIRDMKTYISSDPKNKKIEKMKEGDQDMWSVEESVINYVAEKLAPYVNDSDRLELLLSYIFDFDRRDLTKPFRFYGFSKPKNKIDTTPYMYLKFITNSQKDSKIIPLPAPIYPHAWAKPIIDKAQDIYKTPASYKIGNALFGDPTSESAKNVDGKKSPVPETCKKGLSDITQITDVLINDECFVNFAPILTSSIPESKRKSDGLTLDNIATKSFADLLKSIFKNSNDYKVYDEYNLAFKTEEPYRQNLPLKEADVTEIELFMDALYGRLGKFYNACKNAIEGSDKISSSSVRSFCEYIPQIFKGNTVPLPYLTKMFGPPPTKSTTDSRSGPAAKSGGGSAAKDNKGEGASEREQKYRTKLGSINKSIKKALYNNTKIELDTDEKIKIFTDNLTKVDNDKIGNVIESIKKFGTGSFNGFTKFSNYIKAKNFDIPWDGN